MILSVTLYTTNCTLIDPMTQLVSPSIKTIHYNYFEAGQCAMEEIQQMLKKQDMPYSVTVDVNI